MSVQDLARDFANLWNPDYLNAFRLIFQHRIRHKAALWNALHNLPPNKARIEASHDFENDDRLVVLFTRDLDNHGARINEAWLLLVLAETGAITWFGTEAATGGFNLDPYRSLSEQAIVHSTARHLLEQWMIDPLEYAGIACTNPIFIWGVEDAELYLATVRAYKDEGGSYYETISRRAPVMIGNLVDKMNEMGVKVAGACFTEYNYDRAQRILRDNRTSYVAVRSMNEGPTSYGRMDKQIRGEHWDEQEEFVNNLFQGRYEGIRGWFRSRGKRRSVTWPTFDKGQFQYVTFSKEYKIDKWINHVRSAVRKVIAEFRRSPRSLSGHAKLMGVPVVTMKCDECSSSFGAPKTSVAYPMILGNVELDLGGCCSQCKRCFCPKHVQRIALKWEDDFYCMAGCPTCARPLSAQFKGNSTVNTAPLPTSLST